MINEDFSERSKMQDIGRWYITQFVENCARKVPAGAAVLDAGAGECVYKKYFQHCDYKSVDSGVGEANWNYNNLDFIAPLDQLPMKDASFDAVLCTEVLEHLEWPRESVREMFRVLKRGGSLFLTVPMAHDQHQVPYDFFRYTSYGLRSICMDAGFKEIEIVPHGGIFVRWAYELPRIRQFIPGTGVGSGKLNVVGILVLPLRGFVLLALPILQLCLLSLDRFDVAKDDPLGWALIAKK